MSQGLPSFDLVVATKDRTDEVGALLDSLRRQEYPDVRVFIVDQNTDLRLDDVVQQEDLAIDRLHSDPGLSRARNAALPLIRADIVAFPDDDCVYPDGLLARIARRFVDDPSLDGVTGRSEDVLGASSASWKSDGTVLTDDNLWNRAISFTIFVRREIVERVGPFDERLGLGSSEPWSSGEETDYLIRALRSGARIEYDPTLVVRHDVPANDARIGARDGASVGYLLRKHDYRLRVVVRMLIRPLGGAVLATVALNSDLARFRLATFRGRIRGYRGASRANSSA